jgi:phosphopantothenoylcysteine decarboxylase/phosphopantothenate--cysteine ligase
VSLKGKTIILGVTGGIAAYKACHICSQLQQKGAQIRVMMTASATRFVQPLTFQTLSRHHVYVDVFEEADPGVVAHIDLADRADLVLVAPATANVIGKLAHGIADDMLSTTLLATQAPVWLAPAMNGHMYAHPAVMNNLEILKQRGVKLIEPGSGMLACGYVGQGRMAEPDEIIAMVERYFEEQDGNKGIGPERFHSGLQWWMDKKVLVTAGPTQEPIDPVRYISNHSSGKMGYAIASVLSEAGAKVILISGPTKEPVPKHENITCVSVKTAEEMYNAVMQHFPSVDAVIKAAAVADYQPVNQADHKLKKKDEELVIRLKRTKDILATLGRIKDKQILIGFAAETNDVDRYAQAKLEQKNLDFVVANDVSRKGIGFNSEHNAVTLFSRKGDKVHVPVMPKRNVAYQILKVVADTYGNG